MYNYGKLNSTWFFKVPLCPGICKTLDLYYFKSIKNERQTQNHYSSLKKSYLFSVPMKR